MQKHKNKKQEHTKTEIQKHNEAKIQKEGKIQKTKKGEAGDLVEEKMTQRAVRSVAAFVHKWADSISRANTAGNKRIRLCQQ